ncbi:hypothetical protein ACIPY2_14580 [Paenarthrobacter sp. NPDC089675]|uniref:hypothetical protein n=1 Tax=Paenarthrobacter sp. NPDC089675 TaxID=3364376 RepID=UPI00382AA3BA
MAQQADESRSLQESTGKPLSGPPQSTPAPPRPGVSFATPPPIAAVVRPPAPARLARAFWVVSFMAGLAVIMTDFLGRNAHFERLKGVVSGLVQDGDAKAIDGATAVVFLGSLGLLAVVTAMEAAFLAIVFKRRPWARWVLAPVVLLHAVVTVVIADFLIAPGADGILVIVLLAAQYILAAAGLLLLFLPSASAWLWSERRAAPEPQSFQRT